MLDKIDGLETAELSATHQSLEKYAIFSERCLPLSIRVSTMLYHNNASKQFERQKLTTTDSDQDDTEALYQIILFA